MKLIAKTFFGLESVLAKELQSFGAEDITPINRAVSFEANKALLYRSTLCLRTALRILKPIYSFRAQTEEALYNQVSNYNWVDLLDPKNTFAIDAVVHSKYFTHSKYVALKTKDAIVDQIRKHIGYRPNIDTANPHIRLHVHVFRDKVEISLDSSGFSLHRRSYRQSGHMAPINEALAAGMILLSGWKPGTPFLDPMCGTGTFLSEALMIANNIPARFMQKNYCFQNWPDYSETLWEQVLEKETSKINENTSPIFGFDIDDYNVEIARNTADLIHKDHLVEIKNQDFFDSEKPAEKGVLIINPPYGERLSPDHIFDFYKNIGDTLKKSYSGWDAWIISANMDALKKIGLRASKKQTLYNGSLECKYQKYSLFSGSLKKKL